MNQYELMESYVRQYTDEERQAKRDACNSAWPAMRDEYLRELDGCWRQHELEKENQHAMDQQQNSG